MSQGQPEGIRDGELGGAEHGEQKEEGEESHGGLGRIGLGAPDASGNGGKYSRVARRHPAPLNRAHKGQKTKSDEQGQQTWRPPNLTGQAWWQIGKSRIRARDNCRKEGNGTRLKGHAEDIQAGERGQQATLVRDLVMRVTGRVFTGSGLIMRMAGL